MVKTTNFDVAHINEQGVNVVVVFVDESVSRRSPADQFALAEALTHCAAGAGLLGNIAMVWPGGFWAPNNQHAFFRSVGGSYPSLARELTRSSCAADSEIKMKVLISWSGDRSHGIAKALSDWLPRVIQSIEPWISTRDIDAGTRWEEEVKEQLLVGRAGIFCLVPDNLDATWIHYEAGALSKTAEKAMVIPYLSGVSITSRAWPYAKFCDPTPPQCRSCSARRKRNLTGNRSWSFSSSARGIFGARQN